MKRKTMVRVASEDGVRDNCLSPWHNRTYPVVVDNVDNDGRHGWWNPPLMRMSIWEARRLASDLLRAASEAEAALTEGAAK